MASSLNALLGIGNGALTASQAALQTTGNNVSNVNTPGYSRQNVRFEANWALDHYAGQMGQGVRAAEVLRNFDKFVERSYLNKFSEQNRWTAMASQMSRVESIFNESTGVGISSGLQDFYKAWEKLSQFPDDLAARQALIGKSQSLTEIIRGASTNMSAIYDRVDGMVTQQVAQANILMKEIAELNRQINMHSIPGQNNPNTLMDTRDQKVRELSALIDVDVIDKGEGNYIVNTKAGHTLVDGTTSFELSYDAPRYIKNPTPTNTFEGEVNFNGTDGSEYTLEFVTAGTVAGEDAQFRVSLDGGKTWVKDENGNDKLFTARATDVQVKDLGISFSELAGTDPDDPENSFNVGDSFTIVPKSALYWVQPTMGPMLITPQMNANGSDNTTRAIGGAIAGNLIFRDYQYAEINDQFHKFTEELIWEVNRLHSQGAGLEPLQNVMGSYAVSDSSLAFAADNNGLFWKDKLQKGNFTLTLYDNVTGKTLLDASGSQVALNVNFDPETDSLDSLISQINGLQVTLDNGPPPVTAPVTDYLNVTKSADNRLQISSKSGYSFGVGNDTSGVLAALGVNTYFTGTGPGDIAVREEVVQNHNLINAGHINGASESNAGDSQTARDIAALANSKINFLNWNGTSTNQSLGNYYGTLVANVGTKAAASNFQQKSTTIAASELDDRQSEVAGVNLDEEMSNLIKYQSSYKAAAKLITTADQMLQTLLSIKQ
ncbi:MAG: flagellar hook-associated protein FlgK [Deltaproteobacteria bacterium]|jgi:flagellar hook-associated protein 1 FlgK|nr:flagellar hook-associated protein FlgK [Deltaproteobacteria bacterium]